MRLLKKIFTTSLATGTLICGGAAQAAWPDDQPITIVVPFAAGGVTDQMARLMSKELSKSLNQSVIVQNRSGAGGLLGARTTAQAPADGYTLFLSQIASHGSLPALHKDLGYDPIKSYTPVVLLTAHPNVLVKNPKVSVKNIAELITMAKDKPGELNYASAGIGTTFFLSAELLKTLADVSITGIHYKGGAPAVMATLSGETDFVFSDFATAVMHVKNGTLDALGVTSKDRSPALPDVPAVAETPGLEDFEIVSWISLHYPAGVPDAIVRRVNEAANQALKSKEISQWLANSGGTAKGGTPEDLSRHVGVELEKWARVIQRAGIEQQ